MAQGNDKIVDAAQQGQDKRRRRSMSGVVVSDKMDKTVVVQVSRRVMDARFKKYLVKKTKYKVHSESNESKKGDRVEIVECRPLSKEKRWRVEKILERAQIFAAESAKESL